MQQKLRTLISIHSCSGKTCRGGFITSSTKPLCVYDLSSIVDTTGSVYDLPNDAKCSPRSEEREGEWVNGGPISKDNFNLLSKVLLDFKLLRESFVFFDPSHRTISDWRNSLQLVLLVFFESSFQSLSPQLSNKLEGKVLEDLFAYVT